MGWINKYDLSIIPFHINPYHIKWLLLLIHSTTHCVTPLEARCQDPSDRSSPLVQLMDDRRWDLGCFPHTVDLSEILHQLVVYPCLSHCNPMIYSVLMCFRVPKSYPAWCRISSIHSIPSFQTKPREHQVVDVVQTLRRKCRFCCTDITFLSYTVVVPHSQVGLIMGLWHILVGGLEHGFYFPQ